MTPGQITATSHGSLQGVYRPQARIYYSNARHGILYETITKPLRCRSRSRAITLAREWIKTPEFETILAETKAKITKNPENAL